MTLLPNTRRTILFAVLLALPGCSLIDYDDQDYRASFQGTSEEQKLHFMDIDLDRQISPRDLEPEQSDYRIGEGDKLEVEIVEVPDTKATTIVMPDGKLYYDVAPGIEAAGKTIPEVEKALAEALESTYSFPVVNINTVDVQSHTFSVMGQVVEPGVYEISRPTTVLDSISVSGGVRSSEIAGRTQNLADLGRSVLIRKGKIVPVDFEALIEHGDMSQNVYLKPGDYVYLPAKGSEKVYVLGHVRSPRAVGYSSELTLVKALATAGGPMPSAYASGVLLVRGATEPEPKVAAVDLKDVMVGNKTDFHLMPGDVIWVPRAPWQKLNEYAQVAVDSAVSTIAIQEFDSVIDD